MLIRRKETWGTICYDTLTHCFTVKVERGPKEVPYVSLPLVLNVDLTFKCNMACLHCVAKDLELLMGKGSTSDLTLSDHLIESINLSPFMVVVISGGEPLLSNYEKPLIKILSGLKNKGIIIDTNGTNLPSNDLIELIRKKSALIRVSWDSPNPNIECKLRKYQSSAFKSPGEYMKKKEALIETFLKKKICVSVQTVLHKFNLSDSNLVDRFPLKLKRMGIHSWYIQRFIPSYRSKKDSFMIMISLYEAILSKLHISALRNGLACHTKKDRRHNSVFLLVKDGLLYTQSDRTIGDKVYLGNIREIEHYFEFVSASDHSARYLTMVA